MIKKSDKKLRFLWKKVWLVGLLSGDKGDCIDVWMIEVTISLFYSPHFTFDTDVCLFQKDLYPIKIKTKLYGEKLSFQGRNFWNNLPSNKEINSINLFKKKLKKKYMLSNYQNYNKFLAFV